jgi:hypothetical protein
MILIADKRFEITNLRLIRDMVELVGTAGIHDHLTPEWIDHPMPELIP